MTNMDILVAILKYGAALYAGRLSYMLMQNIVLEKKREELIMMHATEVGINEMLQAKEKRIKTMYQDLLRDAAALNAAVNGPSQHWTSDDDIFLSSWRNTEQ